MSVIETERRVQSNYMVDVPAYIQPPVQKESAISLASALPSNFMPLTVNSDSYASQLVFHTNVGHTNLMQNTLLFTFSLDFLVTLTTAQDAAINPTDTATTQKLIFGENGSGNLALSQYGIINCIDSIIMKFNGNTVFNTSSTDLIQKMIIPYSDCVGDFEASIPSFADQTLYNSPGTTPIPYVGLDGTVYNKNLFINDNINIFSNATSDVYNNRSFSYSFKAAPSNLDQTKNVIMSCLFTYKLPLYVFSSGKADGLNTLTGIDQMFVNLTLKSANDLAPFLFKQSGTLVSNISQYTSTITNQSCQMTYFVSSMQPYIFDEVIDRRTGMPKDYKINFTDNIVTLATGTYTSPSTKFQATPFNVSNITFNSVPKNIVIALVPKIDGSNFATAISDSFGLITNLSIRESNSSTAVNFSTPAILDTITDINGYSSINSFMKSACGYPVLISSSQLNWPTGNTIAGETQQISINIEGQFCSPLISKVYQLVVLTQHEGSLEYVGGSFKTTRGFDLRAGTVDYRNILQDSILMNTKNPNVAYGGFSFGSLGKLAMKALRSAYKHRSRIGDLAKDIYKDTMDGAGRQTTNIYGGRSTTNVSGGKSTSSYIFARPH